MSLPFAMIYCDRCESVWASLVTWGSFRYRLPDGVEVPVKREIGWCHGCNCVAAIEDLRTDAEIASDRNETERMATQQRLAAAKPRGFRERLLRRLLGGGRADRNVRAYAVPEPREHPRRAEILARRMSPPRCLACGSTDNFVLSWLPDDVVPPHGALGVDLGTEHPRCGGALRAKNSGFRVSPVFRPRLYDPEGRILGVSPTDAYVHTEFDVPAFLKR